MKNGRLPLFAIYRYFLLPMSFISLFLIYGSSGIVCNPVSATFARLAGAVQQQSNLINYIMAITFLSFFICIDH